MVCFNPLRKAETTSSGRRNTLTSSEEDRVLLLDRIIVLNLEGFMINPRVCKRDSILYR